MIKLECAGNQLKSLDLKSITVLESLDCANNQLTSLDVSNTKVYFDFCFTDNVYTLSGTSLDEPKQYGFNSSKASNWTGATYVAATNSLTNVTSSTVTYDYDIGNDISVTFTLEVAAEIKPANLTATAVDGNVALVWDAASGASRYAVYTYTKSDGYKLIGTTSKNAYIVSGLTNGTAYGFLVRACGSNGLWSEYTKADNVYATPTA